MSITAKGTRWEILHSLWIGWTFTLGFFNWIAFFYIGVRARQRKWVFWGVVYLTPFVLVMLNPNLDNWLGDLAIFLTLLLGVIGIIHAFRIRKEYLLRLEALPRITSDREATLRRTVGAKQDVRVTVGERSNDLPESPNQAPEHRNAKGQDESSRGSLESSPPNKRVSQATDVDKGGSDRVTPPPSGVFRTSLQPQSGDELEYQITSSYPFPIAFGFRSLMSVVDYRDLYREQLRIAENILAFLASVSLTLLQEQDRHSAGIDLKEYWRSGISPGDWKDIVGRCSNVFSTYEGNPLATEISMLNIHSEKRKKEKQFGKDVTKLIQAKNDYKHDRGPTVLEDMVEASQEVQEILKRCMGKLSFLGNYTIRQVEDFNVNRSGDEFSLKCLRYMGDHPSFPQEEVVFHRGLRKGDLFLELDGRNWVTLYPFIVPMMCSHCKARETYFIDLWDPRRGTARMKSFERGHTMSNTAVAEALAKWNSHMETSS